MRISFLNYCKLFVLTLATQISMAPAEIQAFPHSNLLKKVEGDKDIPLTLILPLRNQEEFLKQFDDIHNSELKHLTSEEFFERFAPSQENYDGAVAFARNAGFRICHKPLSRTQLNVCGKAKSIEAVFKVNLYKFRDEDGRTFYAPDNNPEVPASISSVIKGVLGLDGNAVWKPYRHHDSHSALYCDNRIIAYTLSELSEDNVYPSIALFEISNTSYEGAGVSFAALKDDSSPQSPQLLPSLNVFLSHTGKFHRGKTGAYHIIVANDGNVPTSGKVTVEVTLPSVLQYKSHHGPGWTFNKNKLSFTCSTMLPPEGIYPPITLTVIVDKEAPSSTVITAVTVSGGGSAPDFDADPTTIR